MTFSRIPLVTLLLCTAALAQSNTAPQPPANSSASGNFSTRPNGGFRLEADARGLARVQSPDLDVRARVLEVNRPGKVISQVRAVGSVSFNLNLTPRGGGAPARIEATCDSATLTPGDRKLVLQGNLRGFYQDAGGARNTLSGEGATLRYEGKNLVADLTGGVSLRVPAETLGRPDELGDVLITAQRAQINQGNGTATFAGQARAVSSGGPNGFDVSATRFTLTRTPSGTISTLVTSGRTLVKLDLPPEPVAAGAPTGTANGAAPQAGATAQPGAIGKPTHVEVAADSVTIDRATGTATFEGNVKGFYRLMQGATPQNYDFAGTRAVIRSVPTAGATRSTANFELVVKDANVAGPPFDLGF